MCSCHTESPWYEAFQGVLATGHIVPKCGDNLIPKLRQPTEADRKRATICDSNNPFLVLIKQQFYMWLIFYYKEGAIYGRQHFK